MQYFAEEEKKIWIICYEQKKSSDWPLEQNMNITSFGF